MRRFGPELLKTYNDGCRRKRAFIEEVEQLEQRLDNIVAAVHLTTGDKQFRVLLASEGLTTMPNVLAEIIKGAPPTLRSPQPGSVVNAHRPSVGEVCPEVLHLLRDCTGPARLFAVLRHVVPARQIEIARLMVAMERRGFTYAKMLVALTPQSLLVGDIHPRKEITGLSEDRMAKMEIELGRLCPAFLRAFERRGPASLELIAAKCYFDRLMDNSRVVRYLARNFPGRFEEFHRLSAS